MSDEIGPSFSVTYAFQFYGFGNTKPFSFQANNHDFFYFQVSKVFVPGLLSPTFSVPNHQPPLISPLENISTPARASVQHISRLEEVLQCVCVCYSSQLVRLIESNM